MENNYNNKTENELSSEKFSIFSMYEVYFYDGYIELLTEEEFKFLENNSNYVKANKIDNLCWIDNMLYIVKLDENGKIVKKTEYKKYKDILKINEELASIANAMDIKWK